MIPSLRQVIKIKHCCDQWLLTLKCLPTLAFDLADQQ